MCCKHPHVSWVQFRDIHSMVGHIQPTTSVRANSAQPWTLVPRWKFEDILWSRITYLNTSLVLLLKHLIQAIHHRQTIYQFQSIHAMRWQMWHNLTSPICPLSWGCTCLDTGRDASRFYHLLFPSDHKINNSFELTECLLLFLFRIRFHFLALPDYQLKQKNYLGNISLNKIGYISWKWSKFNNNGKKVSNFYELQDMRILTNYRLEIPIWTSNITTIT